MNLYLFDDLSIVNFSLPYKKIGNFWLTDNNDKNVVNINGENDEWVITGSEHTKIISSDKSEEIVLKPRNYYIVEKEDKKYVLYCNYENDNSYEGYKVIDKKEIKVGKNLNNELCLNHPYLQEIEYSLEYDSANNNWLVKQDKNSKVYLNNELVSAESFNAKNGDVLNVYGFCIVLAKETVFVNTPYGKVTSKLEKINFEVKDSITPEEIVNDNMYSDNDYFLRSPRMKRDITTFNMNIDSPPAQENMQETPLIMTLAPMLTMGASSLITLTTTLQAISEGEKTWKQSIPAIVITLSMLFTMLVWPFVTRWYERKQKEKREAIRQERYNGYLTKKAQELSVEFDNQRKILEENLWNTDVCYDAIINKRRTLWGRRTDQKDFLTVRIGRGQVPFDCNISYHDADFTMEDDNLKQMVESIIKRNSVLNEVPIGFSFVDNYFSAVTGLNPKYFQFMNNLLLQMIAFHSYDNLKFVIFTNKKKAKNWEYLKESPYCFSNDKFIRFFATNTEEMQEVSDYLLKDLNNREQASESSQVSTFPCYYLLLVDDIDSARKIGIIDDLLDKKKYLGFSLIVLEDKLSKIPSEITQFINIGDTASVVINSDTNEQVRFSDEVKDTYDLNKVVETVSNLPVYIENAGKNLPSVISFLELFGVGQIDQLNVLNRWKINNPIKSLKAEVGVNENLDPFILDLHEKYHGPHGLIAGMTGSGKSEFIITYILSMAVNYSPEEVAFVLIDYKGGGLANAFVDSETGQKLPHVVGTITNLDKVEINRALSSIKSELTRRQEIFNDVRGKVSESTIDIYKYQKLYRDGIVREPMPHLIIVSDEFAELKDQQPDFMEDLISTARIGRSLGVHLILATQKPSGVVDAQIWSNSKFKVCLKVQDKSDSIDMIKTDLAAELKDVGRFYLQVGYNEFFAKGQAAWAGAQYYPSKEYKKIVDKNLYFISNTGSVNNAINNSIVKKIKSHGEELSNIVKYLIDISNHSEFKTRQLWLDRIPNDILIQDLYKKYNFAKERFIINPPIAEYDDPENQMQGLLTIPLTKDGNVIIYGNSDSGKDEFLSSLVYSMLMTYDTSELNLYIIDFGAETLMNYESAPQVGNVIINGDDEKLKNLSKMLSTEISRRKKLFLHYNGNYQDYIRLSGETLPNIVVVLNSIEVLNEFDEDYVESISPIIREGNKYGITFVITTTSSMTVRSKISQSCKQILCLQMNNETDYRDILGKTNGLVPSACLGRGLIKLDRVVEFQTGFITKGDNQMQEINNLISLLNEKGINKARAIPTMPEIITLDKFSSNYLGINSVPIGFVKENLKPCLYDFSKNSCNLAMSNELSNMNLFIKNFLNVIQSNNSFNKVVIDADNYFEEFNYSMTYINSNFDKLVDQLKTIDTNLQNYLEKNNMNLRSIKAVKNNLVIIIGIDKFLNRLDDQHKETFMSVVKNQLEILKINFLIIDVESSIKKHEYEEWFKSVDPYRGIWIGMNVANQYTIKLNMQPAVINKIDNNYAVVVDNGVPSIVKIINEIK